MVTFVGSQGSWSQGPLSWPSGTASGDLGVLVLKTPRDAPGSGGSVKVPDGWTLATVRDYRGNWWPHISAPKVNTWESVGIAWKVLTSADLGAALDLPVSPPEAGQQNDRPYRGILSTWRDTTGIGGTRSTHGYLPVGEAGGVVCVYHDDPASGDVSPLNNGGLGTTTVRPVHIPYSGGNHEYIVLRGGYDTTTPAAGSLGALGRLGLAVEVLGPQPPDPPTWLEPAHLSEVAATDDLPVRLTHRPSVPGGKADAYRIQVSVVTGGGPPVWDRWLTAAGTLSTTQQTLTLSTPTTTINDVIPDALLTAGDDVHLRAETREVTDGRWSSSGDVLSVAPVTPPVVTVSGPTGTVTDDLTPTITYSVNESHVAAQARIVGPGSTSVDDLVVWDSGIVSTTGTTITGDVAAYTNGGTHRPWVRARTPGGAWSAWASGATFTMSWTPPAAPTVTATDTGAGIDVVITGADADDEVELERLDPLDGWVVVSTILAENSDPLEVTDLLAPYGVDVTYRARVLGSLDGALIPGDWGTSGVARSTDPRCILVDAAHPLSRSLPVKWADEATHVHQQEMSVSHGIGDPKARVATGLYMGRAGSWVFDTDTATEHTDLVGFIHATPTLTLRTGPEYAPDGTPTHTVPVTVRRTTPLEVGRPHVGPFTDRAVSFAWVEADPVTPRDTASSIAGVLVVTGVTEGPGGTLILETP